MYFIYMLYAFLPFVIIRLIFVFSRREGISLGIASEMDESAEPLILQEFIESHKARPWFRISFLRSSVLSAFSL